MTHWHPWMSSEKGVRGENMRLPPSYTLWEKVAMGLKAIKQRRGWTVQDALAFINVLPPISCLTGWYYGVWLSQEIMESSPMNAITYHDDDLRSAWKQVQCREAEYNECAFGRVSGLHSPGVLVVQGGSPIQWLVFSATTWITTNQCWFTRTHSWGKVEKHTKGRWW